VDQGFGVLAVMDLAHPAQQRPAFPDSAGTSKVVQPHAGRRGASAATNGAVNMGSCLQDLHLPEAAGTASASIRPEAIARQLSAISFGGG